MRKTLTKPQNCGENPSQLSLSERRDSRKFFVEEDEVIRFNTKGKCVSI